MWLVWSADASNNHGSNEAKRGVRLQQQQLQSTGDRRMK
jgi:hypothetical protein